VDQQQTQTFDPPSTDVVIAIIEDEPSIRELYTIKLQNEGYKVISAVDGVEGLELVRAQKPNLVLLDLLMPHMNGDEMLTAMRKEFWGRDTKVIILTNVSRLEAPESLMSMNISRYVVKAEHTAGQVADIVKEVLAS
jgi:DNA-binding response OmpR family regulator